MPVTKQWPSGTVNATPTSYQLPLNNELNWLQLYSFLQSLADSAQGTTFQKMRVRTVTATPDTVNATVDCILPINVASAAVLNLPVGLEKQVFFIFDASGAAATNNITITPNGAETVRGAASLVLNKNYQGVILAFTGTDWKAFGPFITPGSVTDADFSGVLTTAKGGTGQNSTATFPGSGVVATVPAAGVVKSNGTVLSSSNVDLTSEVTGTLPNGNTTATSANTASAIVARDGSGNFSAGTITASLSGNATTATSATTAGNVTGTVAIANGGSGQTTANAALNAFLPNQVSNAGKVLQTDGSNTSWASVLANGSTLLAADGTEGAPGIAFNSDTDTGFYRIGANNLGFSANGLKIGEFGTSGWTFGRVSTANTHTFNTNTSTQTIKLTGNTNYPGIILDNFANSAAASFFTASGTTIISFCQPNFVINANTYGNVTDTSNMGNSGGTNIASATSAGSWTLGTNSGSFVGNNIYGRKDGSAVGAGYVGETISDSSTAIIDVWAAEPGWTASTDLSVSLTAGRWLITWRSGFQWVAGTNTAVITLKYGIVDGSNNEIDMPFSLTGIAITNTFSPSAIGGSFIYDTASSKTLRLAAFVDITSGAVGTPPTIYLRMDSGAPQYPTGQLTAVRIA